MHTLSPLILPLLETPLEVFFWNGIHLCRRFPHYLFSTLKTGSFQWCLHDNAPAHSSHLIQHFLAKHGIPVVRQPPYSPDMAPYDFWLFPKLKTAEMNTIPKEDFQRCFQQWKDRWAKFVQAQGAYFEGDLGVPVV